MSEHHHPWETPGQLLSVGRSQGNKYCHRTVSSADEKDDGILKTQRLKVASTHQKQHGCSCHDEWWNWYGCHIPVTFRTVWNNVDTTGIASPKHMLRLRLGTGSVTTQQAEEMQSWTGGGMLTWDVAQALIFTQVVVCENGLAEENAFAGVMGAERRRHGIEWPTRTLLLQCSSEVIVKRYKQETCPGKMMLTKRLEPSWMEVWMKPLGKPPDSQKCLPRVKRGGADESRVWPYDQQQ